MLTGGNSRGLLLIFKPFSDFINPGKNKLRIKSEKVIKTKRLDLHFIANQQAYCIQFPWTHIYFEHKQVTLV